MSLGPVMIDVISTELTNEDIQRLQHPLVGGVIITPPTKGCCKR